MLKRVTPRLHAGFTLIEMMVTITILALLMALGMPSMFQWIRNNKIRTVADSLQNGLRLAQSEATRRSRQTVFSLTSSKPTIASPNYTAVVNGSNWAISTVEPTGMTDDDDESVFVEAGNLSDVGSNVVIQGPKSICFSALGRLVKNSAPGPTAAECELPTNPQYAYTITLSDAVTGQDRPLHVTVALGGQVRMCDPARSLATEADGC